ncbi:MAG: hypothetical protein ACXADS_14260, partial [Candidatus Thorarchaeota archaeon]|jgi:hypothetical protein
VSVPDILSKFTFDTRRVQHEMTIDLSPTQQRESLRNTQVRRWDGKNSSLRIPTLKNAHGIRPLDLFEIRDQFSDDWEPRFLGFGDEGNAPLIVASQSKPNRKKGRIVLLLAAANVLKQNDLFSELTNDLVVCLYQDGVRQVKLEMDAEISLKQVLLDSGFKVSRTLFEMCLEILQD